MRKIILSILFVLMAVVMVGEDNIALAVKVEGQVNLTRNKKVNTIETGSGLQNKDYLESKSDSYAAVKFVDGSSIVKLFPNSNLYLNVEKEEDKLNKKSRLTVGKVWSKVMKKTGAFEVETPTTVVSVKGTDFLISVDENKETDIFTFSGTVAAKNKEDNRVVEIPPGYKVHSTGKGIMEVREIKGDDIDEETRKIMEDASNIMEIEMENPEGETRDIEIEFE